MQCIDFSAAYIPSLIASVHYAKRYPPNQRENEGKRFQGFDQIGSRWHGLVRVSTSFRWRIIYDLP